MKKWEKYGGKGKGRKEAVERNEGQSGVGLYEIIIIIITIVTAINTHDGHDESCT